MKLDRLDRQLLALLQEDASLSNAELAERVNLSTNACWRRIRRLEEEGFIRKRVALLSEAALDLGVTVFVAIKTSAHNDEWLGRFAEGVRDLPEVVEFYRLSGDIDYMLRIVAIADPVAVEYQTDAMMGLSELTTTGTVMPSMTSAAVTAAPCTTW